MSKNKLECLDSKDISQENSNIELPTNEASLLDYSTSMTNFVVAHPLLGKIISSVQAIDFEEVKRLDGCRAGLVYTNQKGEKRPVKVSVKEKIIYCAKAIIQTSERLNNDIAVLFGVLRAYNGCFWEVIHRNVLPSFLAECGQAAGLLQIETDDCKTQDFFVTQLLNYAMHPEHEKLNLNVSINLINGCLRFIDNKPQFGDFKKSDLCIYQLPYEYLPEATCPQFDEFIDNVLPNKEAQDILFEMEGYCFIPTKLLKLEVGMMLFGSGSNGKGVVYEIVKQIVGNERISGYTMEELCNDANTRAQIRDCLLNYTSEFGGKFSADTFKKLISGEDIRIKVLYTNVEMMRNYNTKFIFNSNNLPRTSDVTNGYFRRWCIIPFEKEIAVQDMDRDLTRKLSTELPGIFNKVVAGAQRLLTNKNFTESVLINKTLEDYKYASDTVHQFIEDNCLLQSVPKSSDASERVANTYAHTTMQQLFREYIDFCKHNDSNHVSRTQFASRIKKYFHVQRGNQNKTIVFCAGYCAGTANAIQKTFIGDVE